MAKKRSSPYFLRFGCIKTAQHLLAAGHHNNRERRVHHAAPERTRLNYALTPSSSAKAITKRARDLLKAVGLGNGPDLKPLRKNGVYAIEVLFSLPANFPGDSRAYFQSCLDWMTRELCNPEFVLSAHVHLDEGAPHMHALILPLVNGKMSASKLLGDRKRLHAYQDSFYKAVASHYGLRSIRCQESQLTRPQRAHQVLAYIRSHRPELLQDPLWQVIRDKIQKDPDSFLDALGHERASEYAQECEGFENSDVQPATTVKPVVKKGDAGHQTSNSLCSVGELILHPNQPEPPWAKYGRNGNDGSIRPSRRDIHRRPSAHPEHPTFGTHDWPAHPKARDDAPPNFWQFAQPGVQPPYAAAGNSISDVEIPDDFEKTVTRGLHGRPR